MARIAKSLGTLRRQVDDRWPGRDKSSDGWIGDAAHKASKSDHNPNAAGVVQALDLTHDPAHGPDARALAEALVASRDSRIKYIISNAEIVNAKVSPWRWRPYSGSNAHRQHVHISVDDDPSLYDDPRPWALDGVTAAPPAAPPTSSLDLRLRMAKTIIDFEARRDKDGHLMVYNLPANDGGGRYEVAGINEKFNPLEAAHLAGLVNAGRFDEAETYAREFIAKDTDVARDWHADAGVEFYLRDCVFNRGRRGAARILQRAVGIHDDDGIVGPQTRIATLKLTVSDLLASLRTAREGYERAVVGYRANLWNGLVNRWDKALVAARAFSKERPSEPAPPRPTNWLKDLIDAILNIFRRR